jgi:hypothetical protein
VFPLGILLGVVALALNSWFQAFSRRKCDERTQRDLAHMPLSPKLPELVGRVLAWLATLTAITLIGIAIWGLRVSADVAHVVAGDFFLVWLVFFGPFLFFGVAILWSTFCRQSGSWLAPLRFFTFVVGLRVAGGEDQGRSSNKSRERALPAPSPPNQVGLPSDSTHHTEEP